MSMYYLHRAGETTGPFAPGRIAAMINAGEIDSQDLACEHGTEEWVPAETIAFAMEDVPPPRESETAPRYTKRPFVALSWLCALAGLGFLIFFPWILGVPLGVLLILLAIAVDRPRYLCGGCGNRVEKTSVMCPACRARLLSTRDYKREAAHQRKLERAHRNAVAASARSERKRPKRGGR